MRFFFHQLPFKLLLQALEVAVENVDELQMLHVRGSWRDVAALCFELGPVKQAVVCPAAVRRSLDFEKTILALGEDALSLRQLMRHLPLDAAGAFELAAHHKYCCGCVGASRFLT